MKLNDKLALFGLLITAVLALLFATANSATEDVRVTTLTPAEQIQVFTVVNGISVDSFVSIAGTASDSSTANDSTNWRFVVTYDSTKMTRWRMEILYANETEVVSEPGPLVFPVATASATITLADKQEIAGLANDSVTIHHGPGAYDGGAGTGAFSVTFFAIDTSAAPEDSLSGIPVSVFNSTGAPVASGTTENDAAVTLNLDLGPWTVKAGSNIARWNFDDILINVTGLDTFSVSGYETTPPPPSGPTLATVFGDIFSILGVPAPGVIVTIAFGTTVNVTSTGSGVTFGDIIAVDTTDIAGRFSFDVPKSVTLDDTTLYAVRGRFNKKQTFSIDSLFNPDGGVNITDSIAAR